LPRVIVLVAGAALTGLLVFGYARETVNGKVRAEGTSLGSFTFAVSECASGRPPGLSVELRSNQQFELSVWGSGDGAVLSLHERGRTSGSIEIEIRKQDCSHWDVLVEHADSVSNGVRLVKGHLRVGCTPGGARVTADVEFANCRY